MDYDYSDLSPNGKLIAEAIAVFFEDFSTAKYASLANYLDLCGFESISYTGS